MNRRDSLPPILSDVPIKTGPPPALSATLEEQKKRRKEGNTNADPGRIVKVKIGYYIDPELAQSMRQVALNQHRRTSAVVEDAMRLYLKQNSAENNSSSIE